MSSALYARHYRKDYSSPAFSIAEVKLDFDFYDTHTLVRSCLSIKRVKAGEKLFLNGEDLELLSLSLNGNELCEKKDYELVAGGLQLLIDFEEAELSSLVKLDPARNTRLEGLYFSKGIFCTQCEAEGFRRITYFLDRPDILSRYEVSLCADEKKYPVLLAGGNKVQEIRQQDGRKKISYSDPFFKSCYLFAVVAGDLGVLKDEHTTNSGKKVELELYCDLGKEQQCVHAMESLKHAMVWDEERFGLECDLDQYRIVAVDAFNMGAMENKGLNIFNACYILADSKRAEDTDFAGIESVVAHEYFHNWTGNRVSCRDWFQLTLKEGLTVYRDQEFSVDRKCPAMQRTDQVRRMRRSQFPEDAGPNAHPIRPESYESIDNFYTPTVYEKGAEVIRMLCRFTGKDGFAKGLKEYLRRFDGQAVTCEDFIQVFEEVCKLDLSRFRLWYSQKGTPKITYAFSQKKESCELEVTQEVGAENQAYEMPLKVALWGKDGNMLKEKTLRTSGKNKETFFFNCPHEVKALSFNRDFSAPIKLQNVLDRDQALFIFAKECDEFSRAESALSVFIDMIRNGLSEPESWKASSEKGWADFVKALKDMLNDPAQEAAFKALVLEWASLNELVESVPSLEFDVLAKLRQGFINELGAALNQELKIVCENCRSLLKKQDESDGKWNSSSAGLRRLLNVAISYLAYVENSPARWKKHYDTATTMTDKAAALRGVCQFSGVERDQVLEDFKSTWAKDALVMDKWLLAQAISRNPSVLSQVQALEKDEIFDAKNPNRMRALWGAFAQNLPAFHNKNGEGYRYLAEKIKETDKSNPQMSARLAKHFSFLPRLSGERQRAMRSALQDLIKEPLSPELTEIVKRTLG